MTVASEINKSGPYTGNGSTTVFAYGFRILDASHIQVVRTEGGADTILTTGFTVSGVGVSGGGNVTFSVAPTSLQKITLIRNAPFTQSTDLENQGAYYAETVEEALDLAAMRDQQLQEQLDRSVKVPVGEVSAVLDDLIVDLVRLSDSADEIDTVAGISADVSTVAGISADVVAVAGLAADVTNFADVYQGPKAVAPTVRNDGSPLMAGDIFFDTSENRMKVWSGAVWQPAASSVNGTLNRQVYTATSGQTVFSITYDVGYVDVWLDGIKLVAGSDFTATNGTTVVLTVGATLGASVDIIAFGTFSLANFYSKTEADALLAGYYTKTAADALLAGYYTKTAADALLAAKATVANPTFTGTAILTGGAGSGVTASMQIRAGNNDGASTLAMGDSDSASIASISYSHANDYMSFIVNGGTRFRLGAAGEWGIGSNYGSAGQLLRSGGTGAAPSWGSGATLLGSLATTAGATVTLSGLDLTGYSFLYVALNNVSGSSAVSNLTMAGLQISGSTTASNEMVRGMIIIDLFTGQFSAMTMHDNGASPVSVLGQVYAGDSNIITSTTSISFSVNSGTFDAGSIRVYGA